MPTRFCPNCVPPLGERERAGAAELRLVALPDFARVQSGDDLAAMTAAALTRAGLELRTGDVLMFAQKVVSKAEGRRIDLSTVSPSSRALELAQVVAKDPRLVELVLRESTRIVRAAKDVLIVEHRLGFIMASAGIDQSNVADPASGDFALLLPEDPDASAARLREQLFTLTDCAPGVVINDSFGRPWRVGTVGVAIGCAGFPSILDLRGPRRTHSRWTGLRGGVTLGNLANMRRGALLWRERGVIIDWSLTTQRRHDEPGTWSSYRPLSSVRWQREG